MKIVRFDYRGNARYGRLSDGHIELINGDPFGQYDFSGVLMNADKVRILSPTAPSKVVAVGLNYKDHVAELGMDLPEEPVLFLKPPSSVIGPDMPVVYPGASKSVEYEAELAIVIGKEAFQVGAPMAPEYIFGFTCANDITARDLQNRDSQWTRAKGFDTFCPLGPHIETDMAPDSLEIKLRLNGDVKQSSSTAQMIYSVNEIVSFISSIMTLLPGDVILTGTPPGVGPVAVGDVVEVDIEGIGLLRNAIA